jgi:pSer/pThr/pTyr-binding forkhead associated (FHA) protein
MAIRAIVYLAYAIASDAFAGVAWVLDGAQACVGRARGCDLRLPALSVSPHHASLVRDGEGYSLVDEGSAHGTYVESLDATRGERLAAGGRYRVVGPCLARVGPFRLLLCPDAGEPADGPGEREAATLRLLALALVASGRSPETSIVARRGPHRGARFAVEDRLLLGGADNPSYVFGRDERAQVRIHGKNTSRRHFELVRRKHVLWVRDLDSTNGTWLDGERLPRRAYVHWKRQASLSAGGNVFTQEDPLADALDELDSKENDAFTDEPAPVFSAADEDRVRSRARDALAREPAPPVRSLRGRGGARGSRQGGPDAAF